jgi:hypothetical protein
VDGALDEGEAEPQPEIVDWPTQVTLGVTLVVMAGLMWLPIAGRFHQWESETGVEGLLAFASMVFAVRSHKGRHKARIITTVLVGLLFLSLGPIIGIGFAEDGLVDGTEYAVLGIAASLCSFVGVALLWAPPSADYFREVRLRRERKE